MISPCRERIPAAGNRRLAALLHELGRFVSPCVKLLLPPRSRGEGLSDRTLIRRILVLRTDGLGDLVMSSPMFPALKRAFPNARVTVLAANWSRDLVPLVPGIDDVLFLDAPWVTGGGTSAWAKLFETIRRLRNEDFDLGIDPRGDFRNNLLLFLAGIPRRVGFAITGGDYWLTDVIPAGPDRHLRSFARTVVEYLAPDMPCDPFLPFIRLPESGKNAASSFLAGHSAVRSPTRPVVVIHPAARWPGRQWSIERYAEVADRLVAEYGAAIILTGSMSERQVACSVAEKCKIANVINASGAVPFSGFLGLLALADLFIGVDSGPMHLADALGTPVIALVGPALARTICPSGLSSCVITFQDQFSCVPCSQTECLRKGNSCLDAISVEHVLSAVFRILGNVPGMQMGLERPIG